METQMTLHDFVLKLLVEPGARAEFELDPEGALAEAGLSDITAADVQEVIPLVVDYAPVDGVTGLVDLDAITTDPTSAVSQLQGITQVLPVGVGSGTGPDLTLGATAVAGVSLDLGGLDVSPVTLPGLGIAPTGSGLVGVGGDLSAVADPANTIDAIDPVGSVVGPVTGPVLGSDLGGIGGVHTGIAGVDGLTGSVTGSVHGVVGGVTDPLHGVVDSTVTGVVGTADVTVGAVTGVTGAVTAHSTEVGVTADPTASAYTGSTLGQPVDGLLGGVTDTVDGVTDIFH
ncbi:hypothetical protein GCM10009557_47180 [Virgisporangium ochraceum]|uniref:Uncharacterized protein n=2 Tax=Virgisporangium ochraceum TaxID=65505 RepID=A0A8J3ZYG4_9ACTN|nr:hypothetical protein Voc01_057470 [Virgisporangium ochraceum]